jgi:hypothetical protein
LRFLLMYSPRWLFFIPGMGLLGLGALGVATLLNGPLMFGSFGIDIHTFVVSCVSILLGLQVLGSGLIARRYGMKSGLVPLGGSSARFLNAITLDRVLITALAVSIAGVGGLVWCVSVWASLEFQTLDDPMLLRVLMLSLTAIAAGIQLIFTAFLAAIIDIPLRR